MLRRIQQTILERDMIHPGDHIIAGVSGGADSTAMLYVLWFLSQKSNFQLTVAHLHHGFRGKDADSDALAVEQLCYRLRIPFVCREEDVAATRQGQGMSFEMAARQARQEYFKEMLRERNARAVALAHTKNDQAETVLMRLLSGTGPDGLAGIAYQNEPVKGLRIIRPLLDVSRESIELFLKEHGLSWREDKTNRDSRYVRSRIRHVVLPHIESKGFPHVSHALVRLSEIMREESSFLEEQTRNAARSCRTGKSKGEIGVEKLELLSLAEKRRVIRYWLSSFEVGDRSIEFNLVERILRLAKRDGNGEVLIDGNLRIVKKRNRLACRPHAKSLGSIDPTRLSVPGTTEFADTGLSVTVSRSHGYSKRDSKIGEFPVTAYVRRAGKAPEFYVRSRLPGDSIVPTGMKGRVFLKDLFINEKIDVERRGMIPVLSVDEEVIWVAGYRVARTWAVAAEDAPSWKITIEQKKA